MIKRFVMLKANKVFILIFRRKKNFHNPSLINELTTTKKKSTLR